MPKHTEDPAAREAARSLVAEFNASNPADNVEAFPFAEFETATKAIDGEGVTLRRVVLVGPWQVLTKDDRNPRPGEDRR